MSNKLKKSASYRRRKKIFAAFAVLVVILSQQSIPYEPSKDAATADTSIQQVVEEPVESEVPVIEEPPMVEETPSEEPSGLVLSDEDVKLIALVTMAEAEGECEEGKRLVIDVILNRIESERFPNTAKGVIYAKNQFASMWNGRVDRCYVKDDICQLVREEARSRLNDEILYFRADHYHNFGTPVVNVGNHYFSKR